MDRKITKWVYGQVIAISNKIERWNQTYQIDSSGDELLFYRFEGYYRLNLAYVGVMVDLSTMGLQTNL